VQILVCDNCLSDTSLMLKTWNFQRMLCKKNGLGQRLLLTLLFAVNLDCTCISFLEMNTVLSHVKSREGVERERERERERLPMWCGGGAFEKALHTTCLHA
jgi:hypothetical protein